MNAVEIHEFAEQLYRAHGDKAHYEAAQKARKLKSEGKLEDSNDWLRIRDTISELRGASYS